MSTFVANEGRGYLPQSAAIPDMVAETQVRLGSTAHALSPERTIAVHCRANADLNRSQASFGVLQSTVTLGAARRGAARLTLQPLYGVCCMPRAFSRGW